MVLFNYTSKELTAKIVYYGPGLCGKTTNLQFIYDNLPGHVRKGKMLSLATKTDRTLFFDFLPIDLGRIRGMKTRVQLYTVPGQVFYNSTRKLVLKGADGVVFVADSQQKMMESNAESYKNLEDNLGEIGLRLEEMPLVMQFNKRDLPHLASVEEMNTLINRHNAPFYEAVATTGIGVEDTLKAITKLVLNHLAAKYNLGMPAESRGLDTGEPEATSALPGAGASRPRAEATGIPLAAADGEMEIESASGRGALRNDGLHVDSDPGLSEEQVSPFLRSEGERPAFSLSPEDGEAKSTMEENLEVVDLDEEEEPEVASTQGTAPPIAGSPAPLEDLSDLLEEIPTEAVDESTTSFKNPVPDFKRSPAPVPPAPRAVSKAPLLPVPETPIPARAASSRPAVLSDGISPLDPLGLSGQTPEPTATRAVQVGAVTPGREHEITVPLEMSVEGRKLRLNLKMTLTLSR